jgi:4-amino-4-deoxy-L-arabinose transferase-like glycosyltransferase
VGEGASDTQVDTQVDTSPATPSTAWRLAAAAIAGLAVAGGVAWLARERSVPAWDQALYLDISRRYRESMGGGLFHFVDTVWSTHPERGPLLPLALLPFVSVFGASASSALALNVVLWPILVLTTGAIAAELFSARARVPTMIVTATMPLLVGLSHSIFPEFAMTTLASTTCWLLLRTRRFTSIRASVALGSVVALGTLTKVTFVMFVAGPILVTLVDAHRWWRRGAAHDRARNAVLAAVVAVGTAAVWYAPHAGATLRYLRLNTSSSLATIGTSRSVSRFALDVLNDGVSWLFVLIGAAAVIATVPRLGRWASALRHDWDHAAPVLFTLAWAIIPFLVVAAGQLQTARYLAPALPAVAILVGAVIGATRPTAFRRALAGAIAAAGLLQVLMATVTVNVPALADTVTFPTPLGRAVIRFTSRDTGLTRVPIEVDDATPIVAYLERVSRDAHGRVRPITIGLLQTNPVTNVATLRFVARTRGDPFDFRRQYADPSHLDRLAEDLDRYDVVLYVPSAARDPRGVGERAALLNREHYAGAYMTPELLSHFDGASTSFSLQSGERVHVLRRADTTT